MCKREKTIIRLVYILLILFNLQYAFDFLLVPYRFFFVDYALQSTFASKVKIIKNNNQELKKENRVGFVSDEHPDMVFDLAVPIKNFYTAQYAIVPAILMNNTHHRYIIGMFEKNTVLEPGISVYKKLTNKIYILKRENM